MKILTNTSVLTAIITKISRAVGKKGVSPILQYILFCEKNGEYFLVCSNSEQWIKHRIVFAQVEGNWHDFCLPIGSATNAISLLPEQPITIEVEDEKKNDSYGVNFSTSDSNGKQTLFNSVALSAVEYPRWEDVEGNNMLQSIPTAFLLSCMKEAAKYVSQDLLRPVMKGILLDFYHDKLVVVGTNGHVLYKNFINAEVENVGEDGRQSVDVPVDVVPILSACVGLDDELALSFTDKKVVFKTSDITIMSVVYEGRYPNYNSVIPENRRVAVFPKRELVMAAHLVRNFASVSTDCLRMNFDGGMLMELSAEDIDFAIGAKDAVTIVDSDQLGKLCIGVKGSSLKTCLSDIQTENVKFKFDNAMHAITIHEDSDDSNLLLLLMPLQLND